MANELTISLGVELDTDQIKSQLDGLMKDDGNKIKISVDTKEAKKALDELKNAKREIGNEPIRIASDIDKAQARNLIAGFMGELESELSSTPIKIALDVNTEQSTSNIMNAVKAMEKGLADTKIKVGVELGSSNKNGTANGIGELTTGSIPTMNDGNRFVEEIKKAFEKYNTTFGSGDYTFKGVSVAHDVINDTYQATVQFNNALGQTNQMMFQLNNNTNEWNVTRETFKESYESIEKTLDKMEQFQSRLNEISSNAFSRDKQLTGDFAQPVSDAIGNIQSKIDGIKSSGLAATTDQVRELNSAFSDLQTLVKDQKALQFPPTKMANTDISESIQQYSNQLEKIQNTLNSSGMLAGFQNSINEIRSGLASVGNEDGESLNKWIDKIRTLKSDIDTFKSSVEGQAVKLGFEIDQNQLSQIENLLNNHIIQNANTSGISELRGELEELWMSYTRISSDLSFNGDVLSQEDLVKISNNVNELDIKLKSVAKQAQLFNDSFESNQKLEKFGTDLDKTRDRLEKLENQYVNLFQYDAGLKAKLDGIKQSLENTDAIDLGNVRNQISQLGSECSKSQTSAQSLGNILRSSFGEVGSLMASYISVQRIFQGIVKLSKNMVNEVKSLDTSLVELQKVTDLSGESLNQFTDKAYNTGEKLGRTGKDVIDAVTTFSRAGYDLQDATNLAQSALVMSNVGVDIPNMESAASDMISIMKAYKVEAEDSMSVIDKLYNVANKQPLDFGNITDMLVTSGGTLAQTNTTIEQTMGLLTGAFATLRDSSVANGLVMISQRLRAVDEDGQAIDGLMPKLESDFALFGSSIQDENGELRSTYDLLNDLAGAWDGLSSKQRQLIGEDVAGKYIARGCGNAA